MPPIISISTEFRKIETVQPINEVTILLRSQSERVSQKPYDESRC